MNNTDLYKTIGGAIRRRRKKMDWTQGELAGRVGISRASLANIETGRQSIVVHQVYSIAAALQLEPTDLLPPSTKRTSHTKSIAEDVVLPTSGLSKTQREQILGLIRNTHPDTKID